MRNCWLVPNPARPGGSCIVDLIEGLEMGLRDKTAGGAWIISRVHTTPLDRGQGLAREAMRLVLEEADKEQAMLYLEINPYGDMSFEQLEEWYKRLGFAWHPVVTGLMRRRPRWTEE